MAMKIDLRAPDWLTDENLRDELLAVEAAAEIYTAADPGDDARVEMLVINKLLPGEYDQYPNLKLIQKTGAGVETILRDAALPQSIEVARLSTPAAAPEMAEYSLAYVLQEQRHLRLYHEQQSRGLWLEKKPRIAAETCVAIMGMGRIGQVIAERFLLNDFQVVGWSRTPKTMEGADCYSGADGMESALAVADYVIVVLPVTPETTELFDKQVFKLFKPGSFLINVGRGELVNETDLMAALDAGLLAGAVLDVVSEEPLPPDNPLWSHPGIQISPHISGYHLGDAMLDIAENYRRLKAGEPRINVIDRQQGY